MTKQALLVHILAQYANKPVRVHFLLATLYNEWMYENISKRHLVVFPSFSQSVFPRILHISHLLFVTLKLQVQSQWLNYFPQKKSFVLCFILYTSSC